MANAFRETLWFKLGDKEFGEAETAPIPLPIEDRYADGEVTTEDSQAYSLHTGTTTAIRLEPRHRDDVSMKSLVGEMKAKKKILAIGTCACALVAAFAVYLVG